jgi:hypothetical protein
MKTRQLGTNSPQLIIDSFQEQAVDLWKASRREPTDVELYQLVIALMAKEIHALTSFSQN